jgi:hypothetical protein
MGGQRSNRVDHAEHGDSKNMEISPRSAIGARDHYRIFQALNKDWMVHCQVNRGNWRESKIYPREIEIDSWCTFGQRFWMSNVLSFAAFSGKYSKSFLSHYERNRSASQKIEGKWWSERKLILPRVRLRKYSILSCTWSNHADGTAQNQIFGILGRDMIKILSPKMINRAKWRISIHSGSLDSYP